MIELDNRKIDDYGNVVFAAKDLYALILKGYDVLTFTVEESPEIQKLRQVTDSLDNPDLMLKVYEEPTVDLATYMGEFRNHWFIPEKYKAIDVLEWLYEKCLTAEEVVRVQEEMDVYTRYDLHDMLRSLIYLIDTLRKNNVVWGVGRGSSVSSYVLYLIGVHRVNSLEYELDFSEFLS